MQDRYVTGSGAPPVQESLFLYSVLLREFFPGILACMTSFYLYSLPESLFSLMN